MYASFLQTIIIIFINGGLVIFTINFWTAFIVTIPLSLYVNSFILSRVFLIYAKIVIPQMYIIIQIILKIIMMIIK